jgi:ubiquinone/menaquinone biosynthesis C-methylase UbiE
MKPDYLTADNAARFDDEEVATLYGFRPPYPAELFTTLAALITDEPRTVLDVGTGRGEIARFLTPYAERVDAVDMSEAMQAAGRVAPGGDADNLHWIHGKIEEVELDPPFALITGGSSLHWVDWEVTFARFETLLTRSGYVAIVNRESEDMPWQEAWRTLISRYSTFKNYVRLDMIEALTEQGLFTPIGEYRTQPMVFTQSIENYIAANHSYSSLTRRVLTNEVANQFDVELREIVTPYYVDGVLTINVIGYVVWGKPHAPPPSS